MRIPRCAAWHRVPRPRRCASRASNPAPAASPTSCCRRIGADIVEKVLLRDLPSLYGIQDVQELNALFTTLTCNTAGEVSLEALSQDSGVSKPTLRRYLEYLEAAFLIKVVHRIDHNARRFRRAARFKVYVTTPALRAALFGPVREDDDAMGALAETAVFAQWFHAGVDLHYARWRAAGEAGEVDIVHLDKRQEPRWCLDVKWSDRPAQHPAQLTSLAGFARRHPEAAVLVTTRTLDRAVSFWPGPGPLHAVPTSLYCYAVGQAVIRDPSCAPVRVAGSLASAARITSARASSARARPPSAARF